MDLKTQFIIKNNPYLRRYLSENSYLYKYLNRNPNILNQVIEEMKEKYKLTTRDKLELMGEKIGMISSIIDIFS